MLAFSASNGSSTSRVLLAGAVGAAWTLLYSGTAPAEPATLPPAPDPNQAAADARTANDAQTAPDVTPPEAQPSSQMSPAAQEAQASPEVDQAAADARASPSNVGTLKVEKAGGEAVVTEDPTTPVIPDQTPFPERAYQLQWEIDVPLFAIGGALALGREIRSTNSSAPAYCTTVPEGCDENDLNAIDKPFAGTYDERWSDATDVVVLVLGVAPWPMLWFDNSLVNTLNDITVIYESAMTAMAISGLATLSASRARPFVYGTKAPEDVRNSPNGALSFVSGHTTMAFALSTSTFWTIYRRHGSGAYAWTTLAVGTALASSVAVGRVLAGKHFPTDVVTGAAVGASVGTLIPALHDAPVLVVPTVNATGAGLDVSLTL